MAKPDYERLRAASIRGAAPAQKMIDGMTKLIAHIGYPTQSFKSPMIYNPFFEKRGINAVVMPMAKASRAGYRMNFARSSRFTT